MKNEEEYRERNGHQSEDAQAPLTILQEQTFRFYVDNGIRSPFPATRRKQREKQRRPLSVVRDN